MVEHRRLKRSTRWAERAAEAAIHVVAFLSIAVVILILFFVGKEAVPLLFDDGVRRHVDIARLLMPSAKGFVWQPVSAVPKFNLLPLFVGSLKVTLVAIVVAAPLSLLAAIYVAELAPRRAREILKPAIELLAGVPSVVIGFFALVVLSDWIRDLFGTTHRLNALVAGVGLAFAICPIVFSVAEDALRAVPQSYRTAAAALGASNAHCILTVVVPAAGPGLTAAIVLGFGRAIGETMIVVLATGNAAILDGSLGHSTRTITATIAQELGEVVVGSAHYHVLFALGALLFVATFGVNLIADRIVQHMRRRLGASS